MYEIATSAAVIGVAASFYIRSGSALEIEAPGLFLIGFFLWSALSISWSQVPYVSLTELGSLAAGLATYLIWRLCNQQIPVLPTTTLMVALGWALATAMLAQALAGFEPDAMFLNRNSAAAFVNLLWPMAAVGWLCSARPTGYRLLLLAGAGLMILAVSLTGSRGALVGSVAGLAMLAGAAIFVTRRWREPLILVLLGGAMIALPNVLTEGTAASGISSLSDPGSAGASRFLIWEAAWTMVLEHPWLGWGPGVFFMAYPAFRLPAEGSAGFFVHNDYLQFWLERGLPGFVLVLALGLAICWLFGRYLRNTRSNETTHATDGTAIAIFSALSTLGVHSFFSYSLQLMPFLAVLGILIAEFERTTGAGLRVRLSVPRIRGRILGIVALAGLTLLPIWAVTTHALYFREVGRGIDHFTAEDYSRAAESFSRARALWKAPDTAWYLQANTHLMALRHNDNVPENLRRDLVKRAGELLDGARQRNPLSPSTPLILGLLRANHPDLLPGSAMEALRRSLALEPRTIEARYALSQLMERRGDTDEALTLIERGFRITYKTTANTAPLVRRYQELRHKANSGSSSSDSNPGTTPLSPQIRSLRPRPEA
ncbi:MAG: O-antigen ligase family protein [Halofilum sp. (in: g-proteobacteria)]